MRANESCHPQQHRGRGREVPRRNGVYLMFNAMTFTFRPIDGAGYVSFTFRTLGRDHFWPNKAQIGYHVEALDNDMNNPVVLDHGDDMASPLRDKDDPFHGLTLET